MNLTFNDTKFKAIKYKKQILKEIGRVIDKGIFLKGPNVKKTGQLLKKYFKTKYILTCGSGHDSLLLALQCLGLKKDDEVIFPVNSYPTAFPVFISGLKGVPADIDENGQLDPNSIIRFITAKTKVIILVHLYGLVGDLNKIIKICKDNKIILIEDCAQAFGTRYQGKPVGTFGDIGCFSFYPTKNLSTLGDGGGILIKNKKHFNFLKKAVQYGEKYRYQSEFISGHSRLPEIQSSVINLYLNTIDREFLKRKYLTNYYVKQIIKCDLNKNITVLTSDKNSDPVNHLFVIKARSRDELRSFLTKKNIETFIHYPLTINKISAFKNLSAGKYPNGEKLSKQIISLPFHPHMQKNQINYVISKIFSFYRKNEKN